MPNVPLSYGDVAMFISVNFLIEELKYVEDLTGKKTPYMSGLHIFYCTKKAFPPIFTFLCWANDIVAPIFFLSSHSSFTPSPLSFSPNPPPTIPPFLAHTFLGSAFYVMKGLFIFWNGYKIKIGVERISQSVLWLQSQQYTCNRFRSSSPLECGYKLAVSLKQISDP